MGRRRSSASTRNTAKLNKAAKHDAHVFNCHFYRPRVELRTVRKLLFANHGLLIHHAQRVMLSHGCCGVDKLPSYPRSTVP